MLDGRFAAVLQAGSQDELRKRTVDFARRLGFDTVSATLVVDRPAADPEFFCVDNTPAGFREVFESIEHCRKDPVMQHCKQANVPLAWNQGTYTSASRGEMWERQAQYGYCSGIALALHLPQRRHFIIGVDRAESLPKSETELCRMVGELQLFAVHALEAAFRVLMPPAGTVPSLTARELECLVWTAEGKTAWELGRILRIAEQTAVRHLSNAVQKLECVNKQQAVAKAMRLGLIH